MPKQSTAKSKMVRAGAIRKTNKNRATAVGTKCPVTRGEVNLEVYAELE